MQIINLIRWLKDVVEGLGGTTLVVRLELVRQPDTKRVHIYFQACSTCRFLLDGTRRGSNLLEDTYGFNCRNGWRGTNLDNL